MICDEQDLHFYLGTHRIRWIETAPPEVSLMLSHNVLRERVSTFPRAPEYPVSRHVAIDSGAFSELDGGGEFRTSPEEYVRALVRYDTEIGHLDWAAPQDHMCEPFILAKTGRSMYDHQQLTVENFVTLERLWPEYSDTECPIMPSLQGYVDPDTYHRCVELYQAAGVKLAEDYPIVGVGSVCKLQHTTAAGRIFRELAMLDLPLHGFGVKTAGLRRYGRYLVTADSMAWSTRGRRTPTRCGSSTHKNEANCLDFALEWRDRLLTSLTPPEHPLDSLFDPSELEAA